MKTQCPHCGSFFDITASDINQLGECGACGKNFIMHKYTQTANAPRKLQATSNESNQRNETKNIPEKKAAFTLSGFLSILGWLGVVLFVFIGYIGLTRQANVIGSGLLVGLVTLLFFALSKVTK